MTGGHNTSATSSVGPSDAGTTAQALLNSITEPVPVVQSGPSQIVAPNSMVNTSVSSPATSVVSLVPQSSREGGSSNFSNNATTIDMKILGGGQPQQTYVNNTSGGGIVAASPSGQQQPSSIVTSVVEDEGPLDLKDLAGGGSSTTNNDNEEAGMSEMNAFIESAAREVAGTSENSGGISSMPVVSTNGGPLVHVVRESIPTTAATVVVSAPPATETTLHNSLNINQPSSGTNTLQKKLQ